MAMESRVNDQGKQGFQRHLVRLRHPDYTVSNVGDTLPEIVLQGSHDRTAATEIMIGMFRLVCGNGMLVADGTIAGFRTKHIGSGVDELPAFMQSVPTLFDRSMKTISTWKSLELAAPERIALAESAMSLKYDAQPFAPENLLRARRVEDQKPDLYTTFNVIQENLLRGGQRYRTANLRRASTREVKSVGENVRLNKSLWALTEKMAELKAA